MDVTTFDRLCRQVSGSVSRRRLSLGAATTAFGLAFANLNDDIDEADARRRKRRRRKNKRKGQQPGTPQPPGNTCTQTTCGNACVNLKSDNTNCGSCGKACGEGFTCCEGFCRRLASDNGNCGACGNECFLSGSRFCICGICLFCPLGAIGDHDACTCDCPAGQQNCGGVCRAVC